MIRPSLPALALAAVFAAGAGGSMFQAHAGDTAGVEQGRAFAQANCARCHAIGKSDDSPNAEAPPFRILATRYPLESLEEALAEGIMVGHSEMPEFTLEPDEIVAFLSFLDSLAE